MNGRWLGAWWAQLRREPPVDPWNEDPDILRERERQHVLGIADAITLQRAHDSEFWQARMQRGNQP